MKKIELGLLILSCISASSAFAKDNIFAPKSSGVSNDDINIIVEERLNDQKFQIENDFLKKINDFQKNIKQEQNEQFNIILTSIEELKRENEELKRKGSRLKPSSRGNVIYNQDDVSEELSYLLEDSIENDTFILTDDIIRLNKEYGEKSLAFVGIIDEHKIYKNNDGEYIVKGLDFDYSQFRADEQAEEERKAALVDSKPPRKRTK